MRREIETLNRKSVDDLIDQLTDEPASPLPLAAEWIDSFFELVHASDTDDPQIAYDLIAAWARLWRADPGVLSTAADVHIPDERSIGASLWSELFGAGRYRDYEERLLRRLPELADLAIRVPDPLAWVDELEEFSESVFEGADIEKTGWAIDLIEDLDGAELVYWAARRYLGETEATRQVGLGLRAAYAALYGHRESFIVCPDFLVAFARAVDYEPPDASLRESLVKIPMLLEELADYRRFVRGEDVSEDAVRASAVIAAGAAYGTVRVGLMSMVRILRMVQSPAAALAADVPVQGQPNPLVLVRWVSPDKRYVAQVDLPPDIREPRSTFPVSLHRALQVGDRVVPGPEATELAGRRMRFAGIEAVVDPSGRFEIPLEQLEDALAQHRAPALEICENGTWVRWNLVDAGS